MNKQIGIADSKYVILDDPLPPGHMTRRMRIVTVSRDPISKFWAPYNFSTNRPMRFKFGTDIEDGPLLRVDHLMTPKTA